MKIYLQCMEFPCVWFIWFCWKYARSCVQVLGYLYCCSYKEWSSPTSFACLFFEAASLIFLFSLPVLVITIHDAGWSIFNYFDIYSEFLKVKYWLWKVTCTHYLNTWSELRCQQYEGILDASSCPSEKQYMIHFKWLSW